MRRVLAQARACDRSPEQFRHHGRRGCVGIPTTGQGGPIGLIPICRSFDSKKVISGLLKPMAADLKSRYISLKDGQVMSEISKAKAQEETPERLRARAKSLGTKGEILSIIADVSRVMDARNP